MERHALTCTSQLRCRTPSLTGRGELAAKQPNTNAARDGSAVLAELSAILEELSGESLSGSDPNATFLELGFDSLALGRFVQRVQSRYGVSVTFRELLSDIPSPLPALVEYILPQLPAAPAEAAATLPATAPNSGASAMEALMREQMSAMQQLFNEQTKMLRRLGATDEAGSISARDRQRPRPSPAQTRRFNPAARWKASG